MPKSGTAPLPGLQFAEKWGHYTQTSVAIGHEIAVTPVQMARAFCVFARDGTMPELRVTVRREEDRRYELHHRVIDEPTARLVREVLRDVMVEGTGRRGQSDRYELFGKSGTPHLVNLDTGRYYEDRYASNFIAGAPFENPRIVVLCVIDDPERSLGHFGGRVAGPIVRDVIDDVLGYLGVPTDG